MKNSNYQANLLKREKCILCHSSNIFALFKNSEYTMVKCRNCGLLYHFPQVSKDKYMKNIQKHYSEVDPSFGVAYSRKRLYKRFLNQIEHIKRKNARLLDVGCGLGYFLSLARNQGWNVYGIEPNPDIVKKGVGILKKTAFLIGRFIFILTWGKQTVAPSIEVFAKNAKT